MYTPHVVTLYNASEDPITLEITYNITVLSGVFLDRGQSANVAKTGLKDADAATLFIPFSVEATDATTGAPKSYITPKAYRALSSTAGYWTLESGGVSSKADCFFVKGNVVSQLNYAQLREQYDDVYIVTTVDTRDFGSEDMQHWQVGGR